LKIAPAALYALIALAGAVAGYLSFRHLSGAQSPPGAIAEALPVPNAAGSAPSAETAAEPPAPTVPEEVPHIKLPDLDGTPRDLRTIPGRTHLYNFWASWCVPCRREIPLLNTLQALHKAEGLEIVGIAVDSRAAVLTFLKATPLHYTVLVGEEEGAEAAQKFGMELLLPFSVFADARNRIVALKVGELHRDEAVAILGEMQKLNDGEHNLETARHAITDQLKTLASARVKQSPQT
jgi:thiol-disulfide isomerase/thioredoxin